MSLTLPRLVGVLCTNFEAWIVGSAADPCVATPRDWDVLVPFHRWHEAVAVVQPLVVGPNSFGGWKCVEAQKSVTGSVTTGVDTNGSWIRPPVRWESKDVEIDVWPGDLSFIMRQDKCKWAWHPSSGVRITRHSKIEFGKDGARSE